MSLRWACSRIRAPISGWRLISSPLVVVELAGLVEDLVRDPELADVVQHPGRALALDARRGPAELAGDRLAQAPDRLRVARGPDVAQVERLGQEHRRRQLLVRGPGGVAQVVEEAQRLGVVGHDTVAAQRLAA
jgi:hypothetical protein